ncbi:MAG TPA: OmpA family protein [Hyphomonadaceae bacterium]|nr:OmpA family protein [Hyphomonadaceae bacterium]HPI48991.1 OmpA family protein [Hyphomonadaceae bacterium]
MKNTLKAAAGIAALSLVLGACAAAPTPSPRLLAAEASLQQAKATPTTFESGRAPLEKAEVALRDAREFYMKRDEDKYVHAMRMGEGYVALAQSRGDQVVANRKITSLNKDRADVVAQARTRQLNTAEAATAVANAATAKAEARASQSEIVAASAVAAQASADTARIAAEARTAALRAELAGYEQKNTALGVTLILRDLQFASGSSVLTAGAQGRLAPLAGFLAKQPDTRIQIAGHTDSQGADATNMTLSASRSASVGAYLTSTGVNAGRISSVGMGESAPVATNDTAAGRAINRRVEVTILN